MQVRNATVLAHGVVNVLMVNRWALSRVDRAISSLHYHIIYGTNECKRVLPILDPGKDNRRSCTPRTWIDCLRLCGVVCRATFMDLLGDSKALFHEILEQRAAQEAELKVRKYPRHNAKQNIWWNMNQSFIHDWIYDWIIDTHESIFHMLTRIFKICVSMNVVALLIVEIRTGYLTEQVNMHN